MNEQKMISSIEDFQLVYDEELKSLKRPTVLICGYTGTGKTTLIQKICGEDMVPEDEIAHDAPGTKVFKEYTTPLIRFWDSRGLEPGDEEEEFLSRTRDFVRNVQRSESVDDHIHIVWYCIQGPGARVTKSDERLINEIFGKENTLVLITKNDITKPIQRDSITSYLISKGVPEDMIIPVSEDDPDSLNMVVQITHKLLPEAYKDAFISAQILSIVEKKELASTIIDSASTLALTSGWVPLPNTNAPIISVIQAKMISNLAMLYGFDKKELMTILAPTLGRLVGKQLASSLAKLIPGLGIMISGGHASIITRALGRQVQSYLEKAAIDSLEGKPKDSFKFEWSEFENIFQVLIKSYKEGINIFK